MEREELIASFSKQEVETTEDLLRCIEGPATTDSFRRMLLLFLRGHYSSPNNYMGFDHLSCYVWAPDSTSTLSVEFTHNGDDQKPDNYPGIYVGHASTNFDKVAVGNYAGSTQDLSGTNLLKESTANFLISHVSKKSTDSHDLAELTSRVLLSMGEPLARSGGAIGFEVMNMAPPVRKKPSPDSYYTVATAVQIKYIMSVTRSLESHRIRRIAIELQSTQS